MIGRRPTNLALAFAAGHDGFDPNDRRAEDTYTVEFKDFVDLGHTLMRVLKNGVIVTTQRFFTVLTAEERAQRVREVMALGRKLNEQKLRKAAST